MGVLAFLAAARAEKGRAIYVWGGDGEDLTAMKNPEAWIERHETSTSNAAKAVALYKKRVAAGVKPIRAVDCSGYVYYCLKVVGDDKGDMSANTFYNTCVKIDVADLRPGDFICHHDGKKVTHIGIVSNISGEYITVLESKGRAYGVVETVAKKSATYWNRFGRWPAYATAEKQEAPDGAPTFGRVLKYGCKGEDVKALKVLLNAHGCGKLTITNGNYLGTTRTVVRKVQKKLGVKVDGIVGPETVKALGGKWIG